MKLTKAQRAVLPAGKPVPCDICGKDTEWRPGSRLILIRRSGGAIAHSECLGMKAGQAIVRNVTLRSITDAGRKAPEGGDG